MSEPRPLTVAEVLVRGLKDLGVRVVFGYPGGPLTPLYDALYHEPGIRHVLARDEQGAGFMADGYARATGEPGVAIAVCGPGVFNALTPLLTAWSDGQPLLLLSGQVPSRDPRSGYYHENDQLDACRTFTKAAVELRPKDDPLDVLLNAWWAMREGRPGPVLLDLPGYLLRKPAPPSRITIPRDGCLARVVQPAPNAEFDDLATLVAGWERPLLMAGGGVVSADACAALLQLAERLGAPVVNTLMGKGAFPEDHRLSVGIPWKRATSDATDMAGFMSPLFAQADGLLAVGCRFAQVATASWELRLPPVLAHVDVDATEFDRHYPARLKVHADARLALEGLLERLPPTPRTPWALPQRPDEPWRLEGLDLCGVMRRELPRDAVVVADVTQLAYRMLVDFPVYQPRTFLHPAGAVSMGFGLPAALGVRAAFPDRVIVAVMGDGCFQMTGLELGTMVQERLPVVVVLINDGSLTLIKVLQQRRYQGRTLGVDLRNPDFALFARAFGVAHWAAATEAEFATALREAVASRAPALVEVRLGPIMTPS